MSYSSLCILSFERPSWLFKSLDSLEKNTDIPFQGIIHDDGSENIETREILEEAYKYYGYTVIFNQPGHNQGQGVAINRMFNIASGDYLFKLDADLEYEPKWLSESVRIMEENDEIGLLGLLHYYHEPVDSRNTIVAQHDGWSEHTHILGSGFCVRRETWEELGPLEEHSDAFAEDWTFQQKVHNFSPWKVALPQNDLVKNNAMGIGNSTIVLNEEHEIKKIHKEPYLIGTDSDRGW